MDKRQVRRRYNHLMTLCIRQEEAFGPLAASFIRNNSQELEMLEPEEQVNLYVAIADAIPREPRRYPFKVKCLREAARVLKYIDYPDSALMEYIDDEIERCSTERNIYLQWAKATSTASTPDPVGISPIKIETDMPHYFLEVAPKRARSYYRSKYHLDQDTKLGVNFKGPTRRFQPSNPAVHKDYAGACAPFMNARSAPFHLMLPFDLKISRTPDDPLDAGLRIWYAAQGYSFPLRHERGQLCSWYDDQVVDLPLNDPNLLFVSVSHLRERNIGTVTNTHNSTAPMEIALPRAFLQRSDALGPFIQIGCNIKVWFDATKVCLLAQGSPDLHEYGIQGAAGLMTQSYSLEPATAYEDRSSLGEQEGLSFNYLNMHLLLNPQVESALIPFNTPIFSVYPTMTHKSVVFEGLKPSEH